MGVSAIYTDRVGLTVGWFDSDATSVYMGKIIDVDTFELSKEALKAWHSSEYPKGIVNVILRSIFGNISGSLRISNLPSADNKFYYKPVSVPTSQGLLAIVGYKWGNYSFIYKDGYENAIKEICEVLRSPAVEKKPQSLYAPYTFSSWPPPYKNINYNPPEEDVCGKILGMFGTKKAKDSTASLRVPPPRPDWLAMEVSDSVAEQLTKDTISASTVRKNKEDPSSLISYLARRFELTGNNANYVLRSEQEYKDFKDKVKSDKLYLYVFAKDLAELRLFSDDKQMLIKVFIDNALCLVESHHVQVVLVGDNDVYRKRARGAYYEKDIYAEIRLGKTFIRGSTITKSGVKQLQFMSFIRRTFTSYENKKPTHKASFSECLMQLAGLPLHEEPKKESGADTGREDRALNLLNEYFRGVLGIPPEKTVFVYISSDKYMSWIDAVDPELQPQVFIMGDKSLPPSMDVFKNTKHPVYLFFRSNKNSALVVGTPSTVNEFVSSIREFLIGEK